MIPPSQTRETGGTARAISHFVEAKSYAIEYTDDEGTKHVTIVMRIGGQWYLPPNGENYAATLRPIRSDNWLGKALTERLLDSTPTALPKADAVDVVG